MKRITIILIFASLLISCQKSTKIQINDYAIQINKLTDLITKVDKNKQVFKFSTKDKQTVIAKNGLKFLFDANQLETEDGSPLTDSIIIEVIECLNQIDFIQSNIQTISQGKLIVSGGAYKISMLSNGKQLKLKHNDSLTVYLPRFSDEEMSLFYGQKDSLSNIQWLNTNLKFETPVTVASPAVVPGSLLDRIEYDSAVNNVVYYVPVKITSLDWINCDRFYEIKDKTKLDFSINTKQDTLIAKVYLIFKDINSITSSIFIKSKANIINNGFSDIPVNANVRVVAVSLIDNKIYGFYKDFKIQENDKIRINLSQMTEQELNFLINKK